MSENNTGAKLPGQVFDPASFTKSANPLVSVTAAKVAWDAILENEALLGTISAIDIIRGDQEAQRRFLADRIGHQ